MPKISQLIRIPGKGFQAFNPDDFARVRPGEIITVTWSKARNPRFHRKGFALFKYVFESLPEYGRAIEFDGNRIVPRATFDQCRKDLTIAAGFFDEYYSFDGSVRVEAKSLAFGSMDEQTFEKVYSALIDVALQILPHIKDGHELDAAVEEVLRFDGGH